MKKCPYCGYGNDDHAESCGHCFAGFPKTNNETEHEEKPVEKPEKPNARKKK